MMRGAGFFLACCVFGGGAAAADTLQDALESALRDNPTLDQARLAVHAAREDRVQANAQYLPQVSFSGSYGTQHFETQTPTPIGTITNFQTLDPTTESAQVTQPIYTGGRLSGQSQLARAGLDGARNAMRSTEQQILLAAVDAYLSVQRDERIFGLRQQDVDALTVELAGTQRRLEVGEVSRTDVAQVETRLAGARASLAQARADVQRSHVRYEAVVGIGPHDLQTPAEPATPATLDEALALAGEVHPDLLRARSDVEAAQARSRIERAGLSPQVSISGRYDRLDEANFADQERDGGSATVNLSVPLFEGGYYRSRVRQSRINVERASAAVEERRRVVIANVTSAWADYEAYREQEAAARAQVAAAQEALSGAERERGLGLRTTIEVLDAEQEFRDAQVNQVRTDAAGLLSAYALLADTGVLSLESVSRISPAP